MARITGGRIELYRALLDIFGNLPNPDLVGRIRRGDFGGLLRGCVGIDDARLDSGIALLKSYESQSKGKPDAVILGELSVDRTRIMRGMGMGSLRPPYEGLYSQTAPQGESVLKLKAFYRNAGLSPVESVHESPDYLCMELAFMQNLCVRELDMWCSGEGAARTVLLEELFLREHLGSWTSAFCKEAESFTSTEFYRGCLAILDAFVGMEGEYLKELTASFGR